MRGLQIEIESKGGSVFRFDDALEYDENGELISIYRTQGIPAGIYTIRIHAKDTLAFAGSIRVFAKKPEVRLYRTNNVFLVKDHDYRTGRCNFEVRDKSGKTIHGLDVKSVSLQDGFEYTFEKGTMDSNGVYYFQTGLPVGNHRLEIRSDRLIWTDTILISDEGPFGFNPPITIGDTSDLYTYRGQFKFPYQPSANKVVMYFDAANQSKVWDLCKKQGVRLPPKNQFIAVLSPDNFIVLSLDRPLAKMNSKVLKALRTSGLVYNVGPIITTGDGNNPKVERVTTEIFVAVVPHHNLEPALDSLATKYKLTRSSDNREWVSFLAPPETGYGIFDIVEEFSKLPFVVYANVVCYEVR